MHKEKEYVKGLVQFLSFRYLKSSDFFRYNENIKNKCGVEIDMNDEKKILGKERRDLILKWLKESCEPIKGTELASRTNVSRQIIVQDISLLKANNEPIVATPQGYLYLKHQLGNTVVERVIACQHKPEETLTELSLLADHGVTTKDVTVEHPIYGELRASVMVSTRKEAEQFVARMKEANAALLSELTGGTHLHTISAQSEKQLDEACAALQKAGFLIEN